jgi:hypothetical protein
MSHYYYICGVSVIGHLDVDAARKNEEWIEFTIITIKKDIKYHDRTKLKIREEMFYNWFYILS